MPQPIEYNFVLHNHPTTPVPWIENATVNVVLNTHNVTLIYQLMGNIQLLQIPTPHELHDRTDNLWQHTCCEIFIANDNTAQYREWNFSPSSQWQLYEFTNYRESRTTPKTLEPQIYSIITPNQFTLTVHLPNTWHFHNTKLRLGLAMILQDIAGKIYYLALKHVNALPDFHNTDTWIAIN